MKKISKKLMSAILVAGMTMVSLAGCGEGNSESNKDGTNDAQTSVGAHAIAGNIWGQGVNALDIIASECEYTQKACGNTFKVYNDNFTADTQASNIQSMASSGVEGMMIFGSVPTLYSKISSTCSSAKIAFVFEDQIPSDETILEELNKNEYYVGAVGTDNYAAGANVAKKMLENGITSAFTLGGAIGDVVHDARLAGFKDTFTAGGGNLVAEGHCDSPADAATKGDDLIAANGNVEGIYALTGDFAIGAITALSNHNANIPVYCSDTTAESAAYIKSGEIVYGDGGSRIVTTIAAILLDNYLDGNVIKDADGNAPYFGTVVPFEVNADNADGYVEHFLNNHPMTEEQIQTLCGASYDDFVKFIAEYSYDSIVK